MVQCINSYDEYEKGEVIPRIRVSIYTSREFDHKNPTFNTVKNEIISILNSVKNRVRLKGYESSIDEQSIMNRYYQSVINRHPDNGVEYGVSFLQIIMDRNLPF